jgi:hydrogenase nickel incorporation protein HypA/HybF
MHEMSLAEGILQLVEAAAQREQARRVSAIVIEIGQLAAVEPDALRFCFEAVVHGTLAEGARLEIIDIPGTGWCPDCNQETVLHELHAACPHCDSYQVQARTGTEMRVREIEIS